MVIASEGFRDEEFFVPAEILKNSGFEIVIASDEKGVAQGDDGGEVEVDLTVDEIDPNNYEAIAFIGGPGGAEHLDNEDSYKAARKFYNQNKPTTAICIAPVILAKAGLLKEKEATVWTAPLDKSGQKQIEKEGAKFIDKKIVKDGAVVTACGPEAAEEFGEAIAEFVNRKS